MRMNKFERQLEKEFAVEKINNLNKLIRSINEADILQVQLNERNELISSYSKDLEKAHNTIKKQEQLLAKQELKFKETLNELQKLESTPSLMKFIDENVLFQKYLNKDEAIVEDTVDKGQN